MGGCSIFNKVFPVLFIKRFLFFNRLFIDYFYVYVIVFYVFSKLFFFLLTFKSILKLFLKLSLFSGCSFLFDIFYEFRYNIHGVLVFPSVTINPDNCKCPKK